MAGTVSLQGTEQRACWLSTTDLHPGVFWLLSLNSWDEFLPSFYSLWIMPSIGLAKSPFEFFPEDGVYTNPNGTFWPAPHIIIPPLRAFYHKDAGTVCVFLPAVSHAEVRTCSTSKNVTYLEVESSWNKVNMRSLAPTHGRQLSLDWCLIRKEVWSHRLVWPEATVKMRRRLPSGESWKRSPSSEPQRGCHHMSQTSKPP